MSFIQQPVTRTVNRGLLAEINSQVNEFEYNILLFTFVY